MFGHTFKLPVTSRENLIQTVSITAGMSPLVSSLGNGDDINLFFGNDIH